MVLYLDSCGFWIILNIRTYYLWWTISRVSCFVASFCLSSSTTVTRISICRNDISNHGKLVVLWSTFSFSKCLNFRKVQSCLRYVGRIDSAAQNGRPPGSMSYTQVAVKGRSNSEFLDSQLRSLRSKFTSLSFIDFFRLYHITKTWPTCPQYHV